MQSTAAAAADERRSKPKATPNRGPDRVRTATAAYGNRATATTTATQQEPLHLHSSLLLSYMYIASE